MLKEILVTSLSGESLSFTCDDDEELETHILQNLRDAIARFFGVPELEQRLLVGNLELVSIGGGPVLVPVAETHSALDMAASAGVTLLRRTQEEVHWLERLLRCSSHRPCLEGPRLLGYDNVPHWIRSNAQAVVIAVQWRGCELQFAHQDLQGSKDIALTAVNEDFRAFEFVAESLKGDPEVAMTALRQDLGPSTRWHEAGSILKLVATELRADTEFLLAVRDLCPKYCVLKYVSKDLQANLDFALTMVRRHLPELQFVAPELLADRNFWLAILEHGEGITLNSSSLDEQYLKQYLTDMLLRTKRKSGLIQDHAGSQDCIRPDAKSCMWGRILQFAKGEICSDREIIFRFAQRHWSAMKFATGPLLDDVDLWLVAIRQHPHLLEHAPSQIRSNKELIISAVRLDATALFFANEALQGDRDVLLAARELDDACSDDYTEVLKVFQRHIVNAAGMMSGCLLGEVLTMLLGDDLAQVTNEWILSKVDHHGYLDCKEFLDWMLA